jgi:PAS domain S-box-containing protein
MLPLKYQEDCIRPIQRKATGKEQTMRQPEGTVLQYAFIRLPVMVMAVDAQGNVIAWNRECERVTGYLSGEVTNTIWAMLIHCPYSAFRQGLLAKWQHRGEEHVEWIGKITTKAGTSKTILWSIPPKQYQVPGWSAWVMGMEITTEK